MSHSENKPKTNQTSTTNVTNLNVQDTEGVTVAGTGNQVTVQQTDLGAIDAARDFANSALDIGVEALRMGQTNLDTAAGLAGRGLDTALNATRSALDFSESVVSSNERVASESLQRISDFGGAALGEVTDISGVAIDSVLDAGRGVLEFATGIFDRALDAQSNLAGQNLSGLTSLARQTSESADDRVTRTAMYAFLAMAAVFVLPPLLQRVFK